VPLPKYPIRKTTMQSLNRASVELDMCPTYPGAWLDCGELRHCVGRFIASTGVLNGAYLGPESAGPQIDLGAAEATCAGRFGTPIFLKAARP